MDLNKMGLVEMPYMEMEETNGGFWPVIWALGGLAVAAATAWDAGAALGKGLAEGWDNAVHGQN